MSEAKSTVGELTTRHVPTKNDERFNSVRNGLFCALAVAVCVLIANPAANLPYLDEFSYVKTALDFVRTGHIIYNGWATAMLGWQIPWGALFIKLFGFSFTVLRFSMLPIAMVTVYLFHQILRRFGINPGNAILGALTFALSPLFLPMAASYMTDVPGLFVILVCVYMCQRAVAAQTDKAAVMWLCSAMLVNVAGGTVRQIAWLGTLIMVPSTAWLLRERSGMKVAGILLWVCGFLGVLTCLHWFNQRPYAVPTHVLSGSIWINQQPQSALTHVLPRSMKIGTFVHLTAQLLKTLLCLLLVIFPVLVAWLPTARRLNRTARLQLTGAVALLISLAIILYRHGVLDGWVMPWLAPVLAQQDSQIQGMFGVTPIILTVWVKFVISLLVIASALILIEQRASRKRIKLLNTDRQAPSWSQIAWILVPFSLSYLILFAPSGATYLIWDRYILGLVPIAIVVLLRLYQEQIGDKTSTLSLVTLALFTIYAIGGVHDLFAQARARKNAIQMIQDSGVPRRSIQAGFAADGWAQIEDGGHMNDPRIQIPVGAYNPKAPDFRISKDCAPWYWFMTVTPAINPSYFVVDSPRPCLGQIEYPPVEYTTWLPPFRRELYVQQLRDSSN